jgi:hypothetical protein
MIFKVVNPRDVRFVVVVPITMPRKQERPFAGQFIVLQSACLITAFVCPHLSP